MYKHQGFKDFSDPLTASQLIAIEDEIIKHQTALDSCFDITTNKGWVDVDLSLWHITENEYLSTSHEVVPIAKWNTVKILVKSGEKYKITSFAGQTARQWYFYSSPEPLYDSIMDMSTYDGTAKSHESIVTVPEGSTIMIVNYNTDYEVSIQTEIEYGEKYEFSLDKSGISDIIKNSGAATVEDKSNILAGKVIVTVGDSITYGADMQMEPTIGIIENPTSNEGKYKSYGWLIAERNNMTFYQKGISGSTMQGASNPGGTDKGDISKKNGFSKENGRYTQLPDDIDFLTIMFGWNDTAYGTLGTINDTTNETYCGGYNVVLPYLIHKYPYTTIVLIVPFGTTDGHRKAVRDLAEKWGVGCFDMCDSSLPFYYSEESDDVPMDNTIKQLRIKLHQVNGAHPGYEGQYIISTRLEEYLRKCGSYDREKALMYNVSYSTEYGVAPKTVSRVKVLYSTLFPTLSVEGHTFNGWYLDSAFSKKATAGTIINEDTVLYAKWS